MKTRNMLAAVFVLAGVASVLLAAVTPETAPFHERKEVAGLSIVFGAEPEPALTEEMQFLRWRVNSLAGQDHFRISLGEPEALASAVEKSFFLSPERGLRGST